MEALRATVASLSATVTSLSGTLTTLSGTVSGALSCGSGDGRRLAAAGDVATDDERAPHLESPPPSAPQQEPEPELPTVESIVSDFLKSNPDVSEQLDDETKRRLEALAQAFGLPARA